MQLSGQTEYPVLNAILIEENTVNEVHIREGRTSFRALGQDALFLTHDAQVILRAPHPLKRLDESAIADGSCASLRNEETSEECRIMFCKPSDGDTRFDSYAVSKEIITIGSSDCDDLFLNSSYLLPHEFQISFSEHLISDCISHGIGTCSGKRINEEITWNRGDFLQIMNLRIIFTPDCLRINRCSGLENHLRLYNVPEDPEPLPTFEPIRIKYIFQKKELRTAYEETLTEPQKASTAEERPIIFTLGPALTMTSASMASGMFTAYQSYLNGRSAEEVLPMLILPAMMLVSSLFWIPFQRIYENHVRKAKEKQRNQSWNQYTEELEQRILHAEQDYVSTAVSCFPKQNEIHENGLLWKMPGSSDFGYMRLGTGNIPFSLILHQEFRLEPKDPISVSIQSLIVRHHSISKAPVLMKFTDYRNIYFSSEDKAHLESYQMSLLSQLLHLYSPSHLYFYMLADESWLSDHAMIRSLPHFDNTGGSIPRKIACSRMQAGYLSRDYSQHKDHPSVVLIQKESLFSYEQWEGACCIHWNQEPRELRRNDCMIKIGAECSIDTGSTSQSFCMDELSGFDFTQLAEMLRSYHRTDIRSSINFHPGFLELYQARTAAELGIEDMWNRNHSSENLFCRLGVSCTGDPISIDIHEHGNGPHGLVVGCTGSGKSQFLITLLLSLSVSYSPRELQYILIDFKGGGASQVFVNEKRRLPHVAGVITNLDSAEIQRALVSFRIECTRREKLLLKASAVLGSPITSLDLYQKKWNGTCGLPYLPHLLIVVDEFAELKKEYPDFLKDLISISRVGRSLGIHLILSTQKPSGIVNDQIWANSRFKVCLKVQEKQDSMEVLHLPDAASITTPGSFCLLCDGIMQKGQCGYAEAVTTCRTVKLELINEAGEVYASEKSVSRDSQTDLDVTIDRIIEISDQLNMHANEIWLPELQSFPVTSMSPEAFCIGLVDDFWNQKCIEYSISAHRCRTLAVISMDQKEKVALLNLMLFATLRGAAIEDEIFLIDDWNLDIGNMKNCPQFIASFPSTDTESVRNLQNHLAKRRANSAGVCHIIINDCAAWTAQYSQQPEILQRMLEDTEICSTQVILFANRANLIPHRLLALFSDRMSVMNDNLQDLSELFECAVHGGILKRGYGLIKRDHILTVRFGECSLQDSEDLYQCLIHTYGVKKRYQLPFLPDRISYEDFNGCGIAIGRNIETYDWISLEKNENLLILSTYAEEEIKLAALFRSMNLPVLFHEIPDHDAMQENNQSFLFLTLEEYQRSFSASRGAFTNILYLGTGFHDQFVFTSGYRGVLKENQAIFYRRGRNQVIQIVEQQK